MKLLLRQLLQKAPEYLFYLLVFLLPWQTRWIFRDFYIGGEVFEYGRMSLYGFDIVLVVSLFYCFIAGRKNPEIRNQESDIRYSPPTRCRQKLETGNWKRRFIFIFLCFNVFISAFFVQEKLVSFYWAERLLLGSGLLWAIQKIHFSKLRLAIVVVVAGFVQGLLAVYQFINQVVWSSKWLGMAGQKAGVLGTPVVEAGGERWLRAYGSWSQPNILGGFLVLVFGVWGYLLIKARDKYQKRFVGLTGLFIVTGIFLSFSRSAWLVFLILYLGGWWYWAKVKKEIFFKKVWLGLGGVVIIMTIFFAPLVGVRLGVGEKVRLEEKSKIERIGGYSQAWGLIKNNPQGVGLGNYAFAAKDFYKIENPWEVQPVHNVYLMILAELGLVGFIFFVLLNCYIVKLLIKGKRSFCLGILLVVGWLMLFDHFWWTTASGMYILWLVWGISYNEGKTN